MRTTGLLLLASLSLSAQAPVPRKAPEFAIVEPGEKQTLLSSYKGKVVVLAFIYTTCSHCQAEVGILSKLQKELGPRGFQPLAVAFNDNAGMLVNAFVQNFHPGFPIGYASRESVVSYLKLDENVLWNVPQIVLIDQKGMIVAQSSVKSGDDFQQENPLRIRITNMLGGAAKKSGH
jgi:peroxiredoxin